MLDTPQRNREVDLGKDGRADEPARAKVLLVSDNRDEVNWGCRATSIALHGLLSENFDVTARLGRYDALRKESRLAPIARLSARGGNPLQRVLVKALIHRSDYISGDIEKSAEYILANQGSSPFFKTVVAKVEQADHVVINGEGCLVFKPNERRDVRYLLTMLELARRLGKPAYYVNAMISDFPGAARNQTTWETCRKIFSRCAGVQVRDHHSFELLQEMRLDTRTAVAPDALFSAADSAQFPNLHPAKVPAPMLAPFPEDPERLAWSFDKPYICVGGSSYFRSQGRTAEGPAFYIALARLIRDMGYQCIFVATCTGDQFLEAVARDCGCDFIPVHTGLFVGSAILANASAFVSGRFHPTILATAGGTPCVFLESNSHKMGSLRLWLGDEEEEIRYRDPDAIAAIKRHLTRLLAEGATLRHEIYAKACELSRMSRAIPGMIDGTAAVQSIPAAT